MSNNKTIYKDLTREEIIDALVDSDIDAIIEDPTSIDEALRLGFEGYESMDNEALIDDYKTFIEEE